MDSRELHTHATQELERRILDTALLAIIRQGDDAILRLIDEPTEIAITFIDLDGDPISIDVTVLVEKRDQPCNTLDISVGVPEQGLLRTFFYSLGIDD